MAKILRCFLFIGLGFRILTTSFGLFCCRILVFLARAVLHAAQELSPPNFCLFGASTPHKSRRYLESVDDAAKSPCGAYAVTRRGARRFAN
jgi:hypothetical protein